MNVTVIVPTYNRSGRILNVLTCLQNQAFKDFEVIVVNDGSTDNTKEVLDSEGSKYGLNLKVIHQANGGRALVRNRGAQEAKDGLLVFMDDDMRHNEHAIQLHVDHHLKVQNTILVGATLEDPKYAKTDMQRYKAYLSKKWSTALAAHKGPLDKSNLHITAANFSISKSLFVELNGFDEALTDTEDYDFAMRAFVAGVPVYYNAEIRGWHDDFVACKSYTARRKQYFRAHARLRELKPQLYEAFGRKTHRSSNAVKATVYTMLKGGSWLRLVDSDALTVLPQKLRYRLYDAIIHANAQL